MKKDINFFSIYRSPLDSESGSDPVTIAGIIIVSVCFVTVLGIFGAFRFLTAGVEMQNAKISRYLSSPEVSAAESRVSAENGRLAALNKYTNAVGGAYRLYSSLPGPSSAILKSVQSCLPADVTVKAVSFAGSTLSLQCVCKDPLSGASFAHALRLNSNILHVEYGGVSLGENQSYSFTITCTVKGASDQ